MTAQPQTQPAHVGILQLLSGAHISGAVSCSLPSLEFQIWSKPVQNRLRSWQKQIGAQPQALYRLMRATASVGVLSEGADGKFSQTPMSAVLRSDASPSLRAFAIIGGREWHARGWSQVEYCVRTGKQALDQVYGMPIFEFFERHPEGSADIQ